VRTGIMLAKRFTGEKNLKSWHKPWIVQPKLDGLRCRAVRTENGSTFLVSSEGNPITTVPHILSDLHKLDAPIELDGELYIHGEFQKLCSIVKRNSLHSDYKLVSYQVFDCIDVDCEIPQSDRLQLLYAIFKDQHLASVRLVDSWRASSIEGNQQVLDYCLSHGYEGIIMREPFAPYSRSRVGTILKLKTAKEDVFPIVGTKEEISIHGEPKSALGAVICEESGEKFSVGTGPLLTRVNRDLLWNLQADLVGKFALVKFQNLTTRGVPRFPVLMGIANTPEEARNV